jgi:hypothetical protein
MALTDSLAGWSLSAVSGTASAPETVDLAPEILAAAPEIAARPTDRPPDTTLQ